MSSISKPVFYYRGRRYRVNVIDTVAAIMLLAIVLFLPIFNQCSGGDNLLCTVNNSNGWLSTHYYFFTISR
jgi:hypothetical protein